MFIVLKKIEPRLCAFIFAFCSAITTAFMLVILRVIAGSMIDIGNMLSQESSSFEQLAENIFLGKALATSMAILVPSTFFAGLLVGYVFAILHNFVANSADLIRISESDIQFK